MSQLDSGTRTCPPAGERSFARLVTVLMDEASHTGRAIFTDRELAHRLGFSPEESWWAVRGWINRARTKLRALGWRVGAGIQATVYVAPNDWFGERTESVFSARPCARAPLPKRAPPKLGGGARKNDKSPDFTQRTCVSGSRSVFTDQGPVHSADIVREIEVQSNTNSASMQNNYSQTFSGKTENSTQSVVSAANADLSAETEPVPAHNSGPKNELHRPPNKPGGARASEGGRARALSPLSDSPPPEEKKKMKRGEVIKALKAEQLTIEHGHDVPAFLSNLERTGVRLATLKVAIKRAKMMKHARSTLAVLVAQLRRRNETAALLLLDREQQRTRAWAWASNFHRLPEHRRSDEDRATFARLSKRYRLFTQEVS